MPLFRVFVISLLVTLLLPSVSIVLLPLTSMTAVSALVAILWCFVTLAGAPRPFVLERTDGTAAQLAVALLILIAAHLVIVATQTRGIDFYRFGGSCVIFGCFWMGAHFASKVFLTTYISRMVLAVDLMLCLLVLLALAALAGVPAIGPYTSGHPVIIFSEPSHFALAYLPMLIFRISVSRRATQVFLVVLTIALALCLHSLLLLVGALLAAALMLRTGALTFLLLAAIPVVALIDLSYYTQRLDLSSDSANVSALVFIAGWQNAVADFALTHGVGVGFQQFGIAGHIGDLSDRIADLLGGNYINLRDGGSTATKFIGEFGVAGAVVVIAYVFRFLSLAREMRAAQRLLPSQRDKRALFLCALGVSYCFELFARGLGYFSPGAFLALAALMALHHLRRLSRSQSPMPSSAAVPSPSYGR